MSRRFLDGLEERVKCRLAEHVKLVDNVDFVRTLHWREVNAVAQVTDVVHAVVARRVNLNNIDVLAYGAVFVIELVNQVSENTRYGRFAGAALPCKEIAVGKLPRLGHSG